MTFFVETSGWERSLGPLHTVQRALLNNATNNPSWDKYVITNISSDGGKLCLENDSKYSASSLSDFPVSVRCDIRRRIMQSNNRRRTRLSNGHRRRLTMSRNPPTIN
ncbi:hypothetical protein FKM82_021624 [Ascaphus truei]